MSEPHSQRGELDAVMREYLPVKRPKRARDTVKIWRMLFLEISVQRRFSSEPTFETERENEREREREKRKYKQVTSKPTGTIS